MKQKFIKYVYVAVILAFPVLAGFIFLHSYGRFLFFVTDFFSKSAKIQIALVLPQEPATRQNIVNAVDLFLDGIQHAVKGKKVQVQYYHDRRNEQNAETTALRIINESNSLLVIGHYTNLESAAAGTMYKKNEIPAITASAGLESITADNPWYYRVIPNVRVQAVLTAGYIARNLKQKGVNVLYENDEYGMVLMENFVTTAERRGLTIKNKINVGDLNMADETALAALMAKLEPADILYLAVHAGRGAGLVTAAKNKAAGFTIFGPEEFASESFVRAVQSGLDKQKGAGYDLNEVFCASPYMSAIANDRGHWFEKEFLRRFHQKPTWEAACYYDALQMATAAIAKSEIQSAEYVKENRRKVREAMDGYFSPGNAVKGLVQDLYFDSRRDVIRPYAMAGYSGWKLISAPVQYQTLTQADREIRTLFEDILRGEAVNMDGRVLQNIHVVYTWVDEIQVEEMDSMAGRCRLGFDLNVRYVNGFEFDPRALDFGDGAEAIALGEPVAEEIGEEMTARKYRVRGGFKMPADHRAFPFDRRILAIRLMNKAALANRVIYLPDELKMAAKDFTLIKGRVLPEALQGWKTASQACFEDFATKESSLGLGRLAEAGYKINRSRFNAEVHLVRRFRGVAGFFLPVVLLLAGLYLVCLEPPKKAGFYSAVFAALFLGNGLCHWFLLRTFPCDYMLGAEYLVFAVYLLLLVGLFMSRLGPPALAKARKMGRIACPLAGLILFIFWYGGSYL